MESTDGSTGSSLELASPSSDPSAIESAVAFGSVTSVSDVGSAEESSAGSVVVAASAVSVLVGSDPESVAAGASAEVVSVAAALSASVPSDVCAAEFAESVALGLPSPSPPVWTAPSALSVVVAEGSVAWELSALSVVVAAGSVCCDASALSEEVGAGVAPAASELVAELFLLPDDPPLPCVPSKFMVSFTIENWGTYSHHCSHPRIFEQRKHPFLNFCQLKSPVS